MMIKTQIAHFFIDDKFYDSAINLFNTLEDYDSAYYIISKNKDFKYVDNKKLSIVHPDDVLSLITNHNFCDILILHSLRAIPTYLISQIHSKIYVVWFSWGYDIYNNQYPEYPLIKIRNQHIESVYPIKERIGRLRKLLRKKKSELINYYKGDGKIQRAIFEQAIKRIDYYSGVFPEEYDLLRKRKIFRAKYFCFNYCNPGVFLESDIENYISTHKKDIQVGHNGSPIVNHVDVLRKLSRLALSDVRIVCPISYLGDNEYLDFVNSEGFRLFGDNYFPIKDFLPIDEYKQLLSNVGYIILNIKRQCGVGNILINIWNGVKLFSPRKSMNYNHFTKMGIKIYSIEDDLNNNELSTPMSYDDVIKNRRLLSDYYRFDKIRERLLKSLETIPINK